MKFKIPNLRALLTNARTTQSNAQCFSANDGKNDGYSKRSADGGVSSYSQSTYPRDREKSTPGCSSGDNNRDLGNAPYAFDIENATNTNSNYRTALWTGKHLQLTVMSIPSGEETGIEMHNNLDQFIRVESGNGKVEMGRIKSNMNYTVPLDSRFAVLIPEGTYHNIINTGRTPLKLYSIYTPKAHPFGTTDATKEDAEKRESH